jgi:sigma-B regulation protein RsbU (phosphoserine phosphatase)
MQAGKRRPGSTTAARVVVSARFSSGRRLWPILTRERPAMESIQDREHAGRAGSARLEVLLEASRLLGSSREHAVYLGEVLRLAAGAARASHAALLLAAEGGTWIETEKAHGDGHPRAAGTVLEADRGIPGWVVRENASLLLNDPQGDPRYASDPISGSEDPPGAVLCVPLRSRGEVLGALEVLRPPGDPGFEHGDRVLLQALANQVAATVDYVQVSRRAREESLRKDLLYEVTRNLGRSLEREQGLRVILDSLGRLVDFDAAGIFLLDKGNRQIVREHISGYADSQWDRLHLKIGEGISGWAAEHGQGVVVPDVSLDPRYVNARPSTRSQLVAPLMSGGKVLGVVNLESDRPGAYTDEDLEILQAFANQAAASIDIADYHADQLEHQRLEHELVLARNIQRSLLPRRAPRLDRYEISGCNRPSEEVGGDYYDFIPITPEQLGIAVADVSGKGLPGGITMASLRAALRVEIGYRYSIRDILRKVGDYLAEATGPEEFATLLYGVLDVRQGIFTYASAGHCPGILLRDGDRIDQLESTGTVLGAFPGMTYEERRLTFRPGDTLFLYTDGITEAVDPQGRQFGLDRLIDVLRKQRGKSAGDLGDEVLREVRGFTGVRELTDDITFVVLQVLPSG